MPPAALSCFSGFRGSKIGAASNLKPQMQELPCDVARLGLQQCVEPLPDRGRQFIEGPGDYQGDALIRLLDDTATRRRPLPRDKVAAAGAARHPGSLVGIRAP